MSRFSPSGKLVCENEGPLDAEVVMIAESPAGEEMANKPSPRPLIGRAGRVFDLGLRKVSLDRSSTRIINLVPVRAPKDRFADHDPRDVEWARERLDEELASLTKAKVYVALGNNPLKWLVGDLPVGRDDSGEEASGKSEKEEGKSGGVISSWRGSVLPVSELRTSALQQSHEDYLRLLHTDVHPRLNEGASIVPTFHPAAIARQFGWFPWLTQDLRLARRVRDSGVPALPRREWFLNQPEQLLRLLEAECEHCSSTGQHVGVTYIDDLGRKVVDCQCSGVCLSCGGAGKRPVDLIGVDTELDPAWIVGIACDTEVHSFEWTESARPLVEALLTDERVMKVAHNWAHDFVFFRRLGIQVARRIFDSMGASNVIDSSLRKSLSPHISTRWTPWAYHKWLYSVDPLVYNAMDAIVCYDAYWPQIEDLQRLKLMDVVEHDHQLLWPLFDMQEFGFRIDEDERKRVEIEFAAKRKAEQATLTEMVKPIIDAKLSRFKKPHLFEVKRKCPCCGGGKLQAQHCWRCGGLPKQPKRRDDYFAFENGELHKKQTVKNLRLSLPLCRTCGGHGKVPKRLPFNPDSADQLADVLYRGLGIPPRRYKQSETVRVGQLEPLALQYPLVAQVVTTSRADTDYQTVARLAAGMDGRLHCVFDPFGTISGRVAGKEGLMEVGTNPMNLPRPARRFVVPDPGHLLLYPDMEQIELRAIALLAKFAGDSSLFELVKLADDKEAWLAAGFPLRKGKPDLHNLVAIDSQRIAPGFSREQSKRLEYASFYGARGAQLAKELTDEALRKKAQGDPEPGIVVSESITDVLIDSLLRGRFKAVARWHQAVEDELTRTHELRSPTGRRFTFHGYLFDKKTKGVKYETLKKAWSRQPQDVAAWVLAEGLQAIWASDDWGTLLRPLIHVHDALAMQTPEDRLDEGKAKAVSYLTREKFGMKFPAGIKVGRNWFECS